MAAPPGLVRRHTRAAEGAAAEPVLIACDQAFVMAADLDPEDGPGRAGRVPALVLGGAAPALAGAAQGELCLCPKPAEDKDPAGPCRRTGSATTSREIPGERDDPYVQLILRGRETDPLAVPEFAELAQALYGEVLGRAAP